MDTFLDFITFRDPNVIYVVLGIVFINSSSAMIGTFAYLRKRSLIGDAIAHALLPGVCLGFLLAEEKNIWFLFLGAFVTGWMSTFLVDFIVNNSKLKQDSAIGIVLSFFFGIGVVLMTFIQKNASGNQGGLDHFLFGQAAAITKDDVMILLLVFVIITAAIIFFFRSFLLVSFNMDYASTLGIPARWIEFLITTLTVLAIASGIQALGVVLMSALIITPAASARFWTYRLKIMLMLAVIISVVAGISGAYVSYAFSEMPTGPWVVVFLSIMTLLSFVFAPRRGMLSRYLKSLKNRNKILLENILKAIYQYNERNNQKEELGLAISASDILSIRNFDTNLLDAGIKKLIKQGYIDQIESNFYLTSEGKRESKRIVRLHRLWEQYLLKRTTIDTEHVHSGAEAIEHILTPEIERELELELGMEGIPEEDF